MGDTRGIAAGTAKVGSVAPLVAGMAGALVVMLATAPLMVLTTFTHPLHVASVTTLIYVAATAAVYGLLWAVGASLDKRYRSIAGASFADPSIQPVAPPALTRTYGMLQICLLPFLFFLFVFSLYCTEVLITEALVLINVVQTIPTFVLFALLIVAAGTIWGVAVGVWRLFVPPKRVERGVAVSRSENLRLWQVVDQVASDSGTAGVEQILLVPGAEIAVWEEDGLLRSLAGRAKRRMRIGLTAIHDMTVPELESILRHEFAHFSNRDTAWGSFTYSMTRSLLTAWRATPGGNPFKSPNVTTFIVRLNPAWWVYWLYVRLFFRSTNGFSRLRELMADWQAISYAGGDRFADGLTKVIVNSQALSDWGKQRKLDGDIPGVAHEVGEVLTNMSAEELEQVRQSAMSSRSANAGAYDTHPDPRTRLAYARRAGGGAAIEEPGELARTLLDDWDGCDRTVSQTVLSRAAAKSA